MVSWMCGSPDMCVLMFLWPPQLVVWMEKILNQMGGKPLWFPLMQNGTYAGVVCAPVF